MIVLGIKTSDDKIELILRDNQETLTNSSVFGRQMSSNILRFTEDFLAKNNYQWKDLTGIVVFRGTGGYTSLRIGITVANTLADSLNIKIIGSKGDNWFEDGVKLVQQGLNHKIVQPIYSSSANITKPKK